MQPLIIIINYLRKVCRQGWSLSIHAGYVNQFHIPTFPCLAEAIIVIMYDSLTDSRFEYEIRDA